jgi:rhombotail lipoprotein
VVLLILLQEAKTRRIGVMPMPGLPRIIKLLLPVPLLLAGCTSLWQTAMGGLSETSSGAMRRGVSSSLVEYLYPSGEEPPPFNESVPQLNIPLRVGLAFVPSTDQANAPVLSEASKTDLLQGVRSQFLDRDYIGEIEIIPETYLVSGQGFTSLEQIGRIYNLDVMALVSYDQVVTSEDTTASILYWTIIGAYLIEGSENDVQTFVDTAVFDIETRRLLMRAPGLDKYTSKSTLIGSAEELRETRTEGFARAMSAMSENLVIELNKFEFRIKEDPTVAHVTSREGSGGGGIFSLYLILLLAAAGIMVRQEG